MGNRAVEDVANQFAHSNLRVTWGAATHIGNVREINEDDHVAGNGVWVVADGMGGHSAGDAASEIVVDVFRNKANDDPLNLEDVPFMLKSANQEIRLQASADGYDAMGTTVCGVALVDNGGDDALLVFNVGDSRCYEIVEGGGLVQLTTDHSYVQELIDRGEIGPGEARNHPAKNVVSRAVGIDNAVTADFVVLPRSPASRLLLCTDGVSGELDDETIAEILLTAMTPADAARRLLDEVLAGPARDNATALVLDVAWRVSETDSDRDNGTSSVETTLPKTPEQSRDNGIDVKPKRRSTLLIDEVPGFAASENDVKGDEGLVEMVPGHLVPPKGDSA